MSKINGRLENWQLNIMNNTIYGEIYADPDKRWKEGKFIKTSLVMQGKLRVGELIQTKNSVYLLGEEKKETIKHTKAYYTETDRNK